MRWLILIACRYKHYVLIPYKIQKNMKTLKQIFFTFILTSLTLACSSDDDSNSEQTVPQMLMSGKWYLEKDADEEVNPCEKRTFYHFYDDNKFTKAFYQKSSDGTDCYLQYMQYGTFILISDQFIKVALTDSNIENNYKIVSISPDQLVIIGYYGSTLIFDKTEG